MCNWFQKLFGCKCQCDSHDGCCKKDGATPVGGEAKPTTAGSENVEKK
ncbi:MAG: hypothetical protein WC458_00820 [Patescibacteria group bacterium]|jgi:hypothetical protein